MFDMRSVVIGIIGFSIVLSLPAMLVSPVDIRTTDYTDPEVCAGCHSDIYAQWNGSMHSAAHRDPVYQKLFLKASRETNTTFDDFCTRCHAPLAALTGETPSADNYQVSETAKKGISCDFCHTVNASTGIGNGAFTSSPGKVKWGPLNDSNYSTFHATAYSDLQTRGEFCGMCHNVRHPFNGLVLENTYTEWKESPYNETTPCQACHMTPGVTKFMQNPGRAAAGAPIREHIYTHYFVGGNAMLPGLLGSPEHERLAEERLRSAARVDIEDIEIINNETVNMNVRVSNTGAGHKIPTGLTEARQIWLEVEVRDKEGNPVFSSGKMDEGGYVDQNAVIFHTVFGDSNGNPTEKVWLAEKILTDNRIPPKGYSMENYNFNIPQNARGPITIHVKLNYMSASQELSDLLFEKGRVKPPVVVMASANATLNVPAGKETPGFGFAQAILVMFALYIVKSTNWRKR